MNLYYIWMILEILLNTNGVKTLKIHNLLAVKNILTYVEPKSQNPDFHPIFYSQKSET